MTGGPLDGCSVVVTRAPAQAPQLAARLTELGAEAVVVPLIQIVDPTDGGDALARAAHRIAEYDWVIVTSPNGVQRLAAVVDDWDLVRRVAVVGPGTAAALDAAGRRADLVPDRAVAEGLLEAMPPPGPAGSVLVVQAEVARPVLVDGLRDAGWRVDVVPAYRTVPAEVSAVDRERLRSADAITFASSSSVTNLLAVAGVELCPPVVVCIGPITAATARSGGLDVTIVADPHTLDGLVAAVVDALS